MRTRLSCSVARDFPLRYRRMRQIGHLENESAARTFGNFLYVQGVENEVEPDDGLGWAVWIHAEEELERAAKLLAEFRADHANPRFRITAAGADELRALAEKERAAYAKRVVTPRQLFGARFGSGPLSLTLIVASAAVFFLSDFGRNPQPILGLFFSEYRRGLPEILHGEVWRLFTPMLIHFGAMHLFFNLLWLHDLGGTIERLQGTWRLALIVGVIAVASNTAQYFVSGPSFGGLSGVVYGLLGYVWMKGKFDPASGYFLHPQTVVMMIVWYFLCLTGLLGPIANTVHTIGLAIGLAWGWLSSQHRK